MSMNWMGGLNHKTHCDSYFYTKHILSRYVNIYDTMAPMSLSPMNEHSSYT